MKSRNATCSFSFRAGIRIAGTEISCDALGFPSDLVFLSHANALPPRAKTAPLGRRQFVTTEPTLRLLGEAGARLRARTLPATFARPFNLGRHRLELVPSGFFPGAASLLCETETQRQLFLGAFCPEPLIAGVEPTLYRRADAICVDASVADPEQVLPPRQQTLAQIRVFAEQHVRERGVPVLLASPFGALPAVVLELGRAGIAMRAHRHLAAVLGRMRPLYPDLPLVPRFSGKVSEGEVLLWPPEARNASVLTTLGELHIALISASAADRAVLTALRITHGFALTNRPSISEILAAVMATGAREVALYRGAADAAAALLRERGLHAYPLGPPHQMTLPASV